jgi:hypothetical protein
MICREYEVGVVGAIWAEVSAMAEEKKTSLRFEETRNLGGKIKSWHHSDDARFWQNFL